MNVMVATDVAARGIDVSGVELVVQVEPPEDPKSFLHRSGRTARAGHSGDVVTIILPNQRRRTRRMMREAGLTVEPIDVTLIRRKCWNSLAKWPSRCSAGRLSSRAGRKSAP